MLPSSTTDWVNLLFSGTETINSLSFNLGSSFATPGTYGAVGSGATFTSAAFSGSGILNVAAAPEPSQWASSARAGWPSAHDGARQATETCLQE